MTHYTNEISHVRLTKAVVRRIEGAGSRADYFESMKRMQGRLCIFCGDEVIGVHGCAMHIFAAVVCGPCAWGFGVEKR